MRSSTVHLDDDVARWVGNLALERGVDAGLLIGEILREKMCQEDEYRLAEMRFFAIVPRKLRRRRADRHPTRIQLHERRGPR